MDTGVQFVDSSVYFWDESVVHMNLFHVGEAQWRGQDTLPIPFQVTKCFLWVHAAARLGSPPWIFSAGCIWTLWEYLSSWYWMTGIKILWTTIKERCNISLPSSWEFDVERKQAVPTLVSCPVTFCQSSHFIQSQALRNFNVLWCFKIKYRVKTSEGFVRC